MPARSIVMSDYISEPANRQLFSSKPPQVDQHPWGRAPAAVDQHPCGPAPLGSCASQGDRHPWGCGQAQRINSGVVCHVVLKEVCVILSARRMMQTTERPTPLDQHPWGRDPTVGVTSTSGTGDRHLWDRGSTRRQLRNGDRHLWGRGPLGSWSTWKEGYIYI